MRVLAACSLGGAGHLHPLLPFLGAARRRGDEVLVIGPPALRDLAASAGFPFVAGGEPPEAEVAPIRERLPVAPLAESSLLANRELFGRLATTAMLPAMERVLADWVPDLVVRDPCEYASAVVAHRAGTPIAQVGISPAEVEASAIGVAAPALEVHRAGLTEEVRGEPYLTRFPASLDPSPFVTTVRFREPVPAPSAPLPDWWEGATAPLVYLTFGTVLGHMSHAGQVYRAALRAVAGLELRVLLTVGRTFDPAELGRVPGNVHVEPWVDQADVLPAADLVVCHGGSGTAFGALAAGLPVVVVPVFADQFDNGRRIEAAGAGLVVEAVVPAAGGRRPVVGVADAPRIADAIATVLGSPSHRAGSRRVAAEMAAAVTVDECLATLLSTRLR